MSISNDEIATRLRGHARSLAACGGNLYRVRAFRQAAMAVLALPRPVGDLVADHGRAGLAAVPGIGESLAETIAEFAAHGVWSPRTTARRVLAG